MGCKKGIGWRKITGCIEKMGWIENRNVDVVLIRNSRVACRNEERRRRREGRGLWAFGTQYYFHKALVL